MNTHVVRRLVTLAAGLAAPLAATVLLAQPAAADVPEGWPTNESVGTLDFLLVLLLVPVGAALVLAVLTYLPALVRGESIAPGAQAQEAQWLGGPRKSPDELAAPDGEDSQAGGASGRW